MLPLNPRPRATEGVRMDRTQQRKDIRIREDLAAAEALTWEAAEAPGVKPIPTVDRME